MNNNITTPHDRFWRKMMQNKEIAREFFHFHLPENIKKVVDLNSIRLQPDSFIENNLRSQTTDLLYSANFTNQQGYIYTLVEHQSSPDKTMPFRLLKYIVAVMDKHITQNEGIDLPIVYPLVVYTGKKPYNCSTDLFDLFGDNKNLAMNTLFKPHKLVDFNKIDNARLKQFIYNGVVVKTMQHIYDEEVLSALKNVIIPGVRELAQKINKEYIYTIINYIATTGQIDDEQKFIEIINDGLSEDLGERIMTFEQICINKGIEKGIEKGKQYALDSITAAIDLLDQGLSVEEVCFRTDLPMEQLVKLQQKLH